LEYRKYKLIQNGDGYDVMIYLDDYTNEFAQELNHQENSKPDFISSLKEKYPSLQFKSIKVLTNEQIISHYPID
jgi:hypothetical protein